MAEIEFRLPSALPYAYVNVKGTPEEVAQINFELLASLYANSLNAFQGAERKAAQLIVQGVPAEPADEPDGMTSEAAAEEVKGQLGATEIDDINAPPYRGPAPVAKVKPWETERPKPKATVDVEGW